MTTIPECVREALNPGELKALRRLLKAFPAATVGHLVLREGR